MSKYDYKKPKKDKPSYAAPKGHRDHPDNFTKDKKGNYKRKPNKSALKAQKSTSGWMNASNTYKEGK